MRLPRPAIRDDALLLLPAGNLAALSGLCGLIDLALRNDAQYDSPLSEVFGGDAFDFVRCDAAALLEVRFEVSRIVVVPRCVGQGGRLAEIRLQSVEETELFPRRRALQFLRCRPFRFEPLDDGVNVGLEVGQCVPGSRAERDAELSD